MRRLSRYFSQTVRIFSKLKLQRSFNSKSELVIKRKQILRLILMNFVFKGLLKETFSVRLPMEKITTINGKKEKIPNSWEGLFISMAESCGFVVKDEELMVDLELKGRHIKVYESDTATSIRLKIKKELTMYYITCA